MKHYFTTPLYYVNAQPHIGHAYSTIVADVLSRYHKQSGDSVVFLTGTDEHGQKIQTSAEAKGMSPQAFCDEVSGTFRKAWDHIGIQYDLFYRTTDASHKKAVQFALTTLKDRGEIEFREYAGQYCVGCEGFLNPTEMNEALECLVHKKKTEFRKEQNYFFRMSRYQEQLIQHYERHPEAITPEHFRNEVMSFLKNPLEDLCISRPKERLQWGIELPFDSKYVTYVWFDALLNYLVATGWPNEQVTGKKYDAEMWASCVHIIGKDILKTHAIYWPTMLLALNAPVFQKLLVHGYWLRDGDKMSKSLGNVVDPVELFDRFGGEAIRYFFMKEMSFGFDGQFSVEAMIQSMNTGLANGIGNLTSRVMSIATKSFPAGVALKGLTETEQKLFEARNETVKAWQHDFSEHRFHKAMKSWSELVTAVDLYINEQKPWALAKDPAQKERLETVMASCFGVIRSLGILISPVLPLMSARILSALGETETVLKVERALENPERFAISAEVPRLFQRIEVLKPSNG